MLGNDGGQAWRLRSGLRCERLDSQWLVLDVAEHELLRLSGPAAEVLTRLAAGETTLPEHLDATVGVLVAEGVLEPAGPPARGPRAWSRRRVLGLAAASAAAAGVAATVGIDSLVLPAAAQASSPAQFITTSGGTESGTFEIDGVYYRTRTFVTGSTSGGTYTFSVSDLQSADSDRRTIEYLLVGGGGGGGTGTDRTGGGGAGGIVATGSFTVADAGDYTVTVGGGGAGSVSGSQAPQTGGATSLFRSGSVDASAPGGGNGGQNGASPGSGGGSYHSSSQSGSSRDPGGDGGNGFDGGGYNPSIDGSGNFAGGGGGGADANGGTGNKCNGGAGGAGQLSSITGVATYYGGGGGGGFQRLNPARFDGCSTTDATSSGGVGGGGGGAGYIFGNSDYNGDNATNGLGGGGGGGAQNQEATITGTGGNGGSGIVIIRYQVPPP